MSNWILYVLIAIVTALALGPVFISLLNNTQFTTGDVVGWAIVAILVVVAGIGGAGSPRNDGG